MAANGSRGNTRLVPWLPFILASGVMILLCLIGKRFESHWVVLLFAAAWVAHLSLLLLFPRNVTGAHTVIALFCPAVLCRFALLLGNIGGPTVTAAFLPVVFDLGTLAMLMGLLHQRRLELRWSILYALNPVILYAFAGQGNPEAALLFLLLGAIYFYGRKKWGWMFLFTGLSVPIGWVSAAALPFLFRRENWKHAWVAAAAGLLAWFYYPHSGLNIPLFAPSRVVEGLSFSGPIYALIEAVSGNRSVAASASFILLCAALFYGYGHLHPLRNRLHENDPVSGCFFALAACLLVSRSLSIGSLSWVIPFIALRPSASWVLLSLTFGAVFFGVGANSIAGRGLWVPLLIWVPFGTLFFHDLYLAWRRSHAPAGNFPATSISVVIPVLNEADRIESCIAAAKAHPAVDEIIVVDGGSTDTTLERAARTGAITIRLQPGNQNRGRGGQIYPGIQAASKDLVAIVHADTRVNRPTFQKMLDLMKRQHLFAGGAVGSVFNGNGWRFRILEIANDFRMVCMGISFGDQVQFFRREPVIKSGLFPDIPLMEDVEFSIRLHRLGRQAYLFGDAEVSTRKWEKQGPGHALTVIRLFGTYLLQRLWKTPDTHAMYRTYYGNREDAG